MYTKIFKRFIALLNDVGMKKKLMSSYIILIIIPLGLFSKIIFDKASSEFREQIIYSATKSLDQAVTFLNYKFKQSSSITDTIYFNQDIQEILMRNKEFYKDDAFLLNQDMSKLSTYLDNYKSDEGLYHVRIYLSNGIDSINEINSIANIDSIKNTYWYKQFLINNTKLQFLLPERFSPFDDNIVISIVRKVMDINQYANIHAIIRIDILESEIKKIINNASISEKSIIYLQSMDGNIVSSNNDSILESLSNNTDFSLLTSKNISNWEKRKINNEIFYVRSIHIANTDWLLFSLIPEKDITSTGIKLGSYILFLVAVIIIISYIFAYFFASSSIKRLDLLVKSMEMLEEGNFNIHLPVDNKDEIGKLMCKINFTAMKMGEMVEAQFNAGKIIKSAELKALQSQINPHFLYNTLDIINWLAAINQIPEIVSTVQNLARFYKISLSNGNEIIPIAEEIEHVKVYVEIQKMRFRNQIALELDIDKDLLQYSILKIILQPIVENSIIHGILEKDSKSGTVRIVGKTDKVDVFILIEDDGIGMENEILHNILNRKKSSQSSGYGIFNIEERIKLFYGLDYGLKYTSKYGKGTSVKIKIPARKFNSTNNI